MVDIDIDRKTQHAAELAHSPLSAMEIGPFPLAVSPGS
jgi:hypothetical protein